MNRWRRRLQWAGGLILLVMVAACSPGRAYEALLVLKDIQAGAGDSRLKQKTPDPRRTAVRFTESGRIYRGDLYRPAEPPRSGLLLLPGAAEEGKDDPRLVAFARTLARARFTVLVPDLASLKQLRVRPENIQQARDAFAWLVSQPHLAPGQRGGMVAFSYAAGPVVLAAAQTAIRERVQFILAIGGYYDLIDVLTYFTTGYYRRQGAWRYMAPNTYGKWVFVQSNLQRLSDPGDRRIFRRMTARKLADPEAPLDDLAAGLGPEGRDLYTFLVNSRPELAPRLLARLPEGIRADIAALNLAGQDLSGLQARLLLIHGYDDRIIPYTQSVALAGALPEDQSRLYLVHGLAHVDVNPGFVDFWRYWRAVYALLGERDGRE